MGGKEELFLSAQMSAEKLDLKCVILAVRCKALDVDHEPLAEYSIGHHQHGLVLTTAYTVDP